MPNASSWAAARFGAPAPGSSGYLLAPPVPATNSRMPSEGSNVPKGSCGNHRW